MMITIEIPDALADEIRSRLPEDETLESAALKALKILLRDAILREASERMEQERRAAVQVRLAAENARLGL